MFLEITNLNPVTEPRVSVSLRVQQLQKGQKERGFTTGQPCFKLCSGEWDVSYGSGRGGRGGSLALGHGT